MYYYNSGKTERKAIEVFLKCNFVKMLENNIDCLVNQEFRDITENTSTFDFVDIMSKSPNDNNKKYWKEKDSQTKFVYELIYQCLEFMNSYEQLEMSIALLEKSDKQDNKYDLSRYYFETFISELYIFRKRIENIHNIMWKQARVLKMASEIDLINKNKDDFIKRLSLLNKDRTSHVHFDRYSDDFFLKVKTYRYFIKEIPVIDKDILEKDLIEIYAIHKKSLLEVMQAKLVVLEHITIDILDKLALPFKKIYNSSGSQKFEIFRFNIPEKQPI